MHNMLLNMCTLSVIYYLIWRDIVWIKVQSQTTEASFKYSDGIQNKSWTWQMKGKTIVIHFSHVFNTKAKTDLL